MKNGKKKGFALTGSMAMGTMVIAAPLSAIANEANQNGEDTPNILNVTPNEDFKINDSNDKGYVTLTWDKVADVGEYYIAKLEKVGDEYVLVDEVISDSNDYIDFLEKDGSYKYLVAPFIDEEADLSNVGQVIINQGVDVPNDTQIPNVSELTEEQIEAIKLLAQDYKSEVTSNAELKKATEDFLNDVLKDKALMADLTRYANEELVPYVDKVANEIIESGDISNLENQIAELEKETAQKLKSHLVTVPEFQSHVQAYESELLKLEAKLSASFEDSLILDLEEIAGKPLYDQSRKVFDDEIADGLTEYFENAFTQDAALNQLLEKALDNSDVPEEINDATDEAKEEPKEEPEEEPVKDDNKEEPAPPINIEPTDKGSHTTETEPKDEDKQDKPVVAEKLTAEQLAQIDTMAEKYAKTVVKHPAIESAYVKYVNALTNDEALLKDLEGYINGELNDYVEKQAEIIAESNDFNAIGDKFAELEVEVSKKVEAFLVKNQHFIKHTNTLANDINAVQADLDKTIHVEAKKELQALVGDALLADATKQFNSEFEKDLETELTKLTGDKLDLNNLLEKAEALGEKQETTPGKDDDKATTTPSKDNGTKPSTNPSKDSGKTPSTKDNSNSDIAVSIDDDEPLIDESKMPSKVVDENVVKDDGSTIVVDKPIDGSVPNKVANPEKASNTVVDENVVEDDGSTIVVDQPLDTDNPSTPKTGDGSLQKTATPLMVSIVSLLAAFVLLPTRLFKRRNQF